MPRYVPGFGSKTAKIVFVGEAPGAVEDASGVPFSGPSGDLLWEICREIGIDKREVYTTNVSKYRPPMNDFSKLEHLEGVKLDDQVRQLWDEIEAINPNVIVALGNTPLKHLTGKNSITRWRGSCIQALYGKFKVLASLHPAALLHSESDDYERKGPLSYSWRQVIKLDLLKAIAESETQLYHPPDKVVEIAKDSVALSNFLAQHQGEKIVAVDIEAERSIPYCIGLAFNNWHAMSVPLFDIWKVFKNEEGGPARHQLVEMWQLLSELFESDVKIVGQNFKFDQGQLADLCAFNIPNFYCDTSLLAHALHCEFPKSLEFNTSIYTNVPYYKEEGREFNWHKDKVERILHYNGLDACVTYEVFEEMYKEAKELVIPGFPNWADDFAVGYNRDLHYFYSDIEKVGFKVDLEKQKDLVKLYTNLIEESQKEINELVGCEFNVNSNPQCSVIVYQQLKFPFRKGTSEETITALLANTKKVPDSSRKILDLILRIRRLKLSKKKYFSASVDFDDRMKTSYTIAGTETGRSNTKILKPPLRPIKMGIPFQTITKHGDIGTEIREMFIADDGYLLVEHDMSQAESRIVALVGNDKKLLDLFASKADIHSITTCMIFGIKLSEVTKELRFIGKTVRHAGAYDMGKHRLMEIVNTDAKKFKIDVTISEYKAGIILDKFHAFSPNIRGVYHESIKKALVDNNRIIVNPFGRYRQFFGRLGHDLFKEAYAHLPQSTVPDQLRKAGMKAKKRFEAEGVDARFVVEAHDALVGIVKEDHVLQYHKIMTEELERPIDFSRCTLSRGPLVIPSEAKVGTNYKNLKDFHKVYALAS